MSEEPDICARCATLFPTCCRTDPAGVSACFPLSEAEWERLRPVAETLGRVSRVAEGNTKEFVRAMHSLFPGEKGALLAAFPLPGTHYRLATTAEGACVFLNSGGCALPRAVRPWYCQLFPIWIRKGRMDRFVARDCLVTREERGMSGALASVGLSPEEAARLHASLCRDWGLGPAAAHFREHDKVSL